MFSGGFGGSQGFSMGGMSATQPDVLGTQGDAAKRPRQEVKETCLPVTIRAVEAALEERGETGQDLKFYGVAEPSMVIVVAAVESVVRQAANLEVTLNDSTGRIKGRFFVTDQRTEELDRIVPGCYVNAFGEVRASPVPHIALKGVRPVDSADEVSYHMIEAAHAMLHLQKGRKGLDDPMTPAANKVAPEDRLDGAAVARADDLTPQKPGPNPYAEATATTGAVLPTIPETPAAQVPVKAEVAKGPPTGADLRSAVLAMLRDSSNGPEGLHLDAITQKVGANTADVKAIVTELVDDGELFNTTTDEHFAAV